MRNAPPFARETVSNVLNGVRSDSVEDVVFGRLPVENR